MSDDKRILKIIHISDLRFGNNYSVSTWKNLLKKAKTLTPHLILITGDLVDSPFHWSLSFAKKKLLQLVQTLEGNKETECKIIIVPGNHDLRLWGLFPFPSLLNTVGLFFDLAAMKRDNAT